MGPADAFPVDEEMEGGGSGAGGSGGASERAGLRYQIIVALVAAVIFVGSMVSPPSLMDDVDAVQAQIARNMLQSGDWVTARLNGVAYLEKSPLKYWMIAVSFGIFGAHDWAARIPLALSTVLLCWVTARFAAWAFGRRVGLYAGLVLGTSVGLFLFTRILIPDVMLTLTITIALWGMVRALEEEERHPAAWAMAMWAAIGTGLLLKGLIAAAVAGDVGDAIGAGDRGAMAHTGDAAQSAVLRLDDAQREGLVSRVLLVLFHERARAAVLKPAVSAGLQHSAAGILLAISPAVVLSVERVFSGGGAVAVPGWRPGVAGTAVVFVLGGIHPDILHVFDHAGVLFDAVLSGAGAATVGR